MNCKQLTLKFLFLIIPFLCFSQSRLENILNNLTCQTYNTLSNTFEGEPHGVIVSSCKNRIFFERLGDTKINSVAIIYTNIAVPSLCGTSPLFGQVEDCDCFFESGPYFTGACYTLKIQTDKGTFYTKIEISDQDCVCPEPDPILPNTFNWGSGYSIDQFNDDWYINIGNGDPESVRVEYNNDNSAFQPSALQINGNSLRFFVDAGSTGNDPDNFRSEIRVDHFPIEYSVGVKQELEWTYTFPDNPGTENDYIPDPYSTFTIYQNKLNEGSPTFELKVVRAGQANNDGTTNQTDAGEIQIVNKGVAVDNNKQRVNTDIVPVAGTVLTVRIRLKYLRDCQNTISNILVITLESSDGPTFTYTANASIQEDEPWGGNHKFGLYTHNWNDHPSLLQASRNAGISTRELLMGPLTFTNTCIYETNDPNPNYTEDLIQINPIDELTLSDKKNRKGISTQDSNNIELENITVFPNPFSGILHVNLPQANNKSNAKIKVYNEYGHRLFYSSTSESKISLDTQDWPTGLYFLEIMDGENVTIKKLVKSN